MPKGSHAPTGEDILLARTPAEFAETIGCVHRRSGLRAATRSTMHATWCASDYSDRRDRERTPRASTAALLQGMRLLVLLSRVPYPLEKGDKLRAYHLVNAGSPAATRSILCCLSDQRIAPEHIEHLRSFCQHIEVVAHPAAGASC